MGMTNITAESVRQLAQAAESLICSHHCPSALPEGSGTAGRRGGSHNRRQAKKVQSPTYERLIVDFDKNPAIISEKHKTRHPLDPRES
jgi:hypothetical protein